MKNNRTLRLIKSPSQPQADYVFYINEEGVSATESVKKKKIDEVDKQLSNSNDLIDKSLLR